MVKSRSQAFTLSNAKMKTDKYKDSPVKESSKVKNRPSKSPSKTTVKTPEKNSMRSIEKQPWKGSEKGILKSSDKKSSKSSERRTYKNKSKKSPEKSLSKYISKGKEKEIAEKIDKLIEESKDEILPKSIEQELLESLQNDTSDKLSPTGRLIDFCNKRAEVKTELARRLSPQKSFEKVLVYSNNPKFNFETSMKNLEEVKEHGIEHIPGETEVEEQARMKLAGEFLPVLQEKVERM